MSDELLRYLGEHSGKLRTTSYTDPRTGKSKGRLEGGTWLCLLIAICYHANPIDRQCFAGIKRLASEAQCNLDSVYQWLGLFEHLGWIAPRADRRGDNTHKKSKCWEVTLPDLISLEALAEPEKVPEKVPVVIPLIVPPSSARNGSGSGTYENGVREQEREQEHENPPVKKLWTVKSQPSSNCGEFSLLEQTLNQYAELELEKSTHVGNPGAWKAKVIANARSAKVRDTDETYKAYAQRLLDREYKPSDIAKHLADGCLQNGSMKWWEKREGYENCETV